MSHDLRLRQPGVSVCFRVVLKDRNKRTLTEQVGPLRDAVRATMSERPFQIDARVVLSDHLHAICSPPVGDTDHSTRRRLIKTRAAEWMRDACGWGDGARNHAPYGWLVRNELDKWAKSGERDVRRQAGRECRFKGRPQIRSATIRRSFGNQTMSVRETPAAPRSFNLGEFHFSVLGPDCVDEDFRAVTSSEALLTGLFGSDWPKGLTWNRNLADLQRHAREFDENVAFAWVVRNPTGGYLGCVYLQPEWHVRFPRTVYLWLQVSESSAERVADLVQRLKRWMPGAGYDPEQYAFVTP